MFLTKLDQKEIKQDFSKIQHYDDVKNLEIKNHDLYLEATRFFQQLFNGYACMRGTSKLCTVPKILLKNAFHRMPDAKPIPKTSYPNCISSTR